MIRVAPGARIIYMDVVCTQRCVMATIVEACFGRNDKFGGSREMEVGFKVQVGVGVCDRNTVGVLFLEEKSVRGLLWLFPVFGSEN